MPEISQAWLALAGAVLGGSGLKVIEYWLNRPKNKSDAMADFRNELRDEVKSLREELRLSEEELDKWRDRYYALMDEYLKFKSSALIVQNLPALMEQYEKNKLTGK